MLRTGNHRSKTAKICIFHQPLACHPNCMNTKPVQTNQYIMTFATITLHTIQYLPTSLTSLTSYTLAEAVVIRSLMCWARYSAYVGYVQTVTAHIIPHFKLKSFFIYGCGFLSETY